MLRTATLLVPLAVLPSLEQRTLPVPVEIAPHEARIVRMAVSDDEKTLVTADRDGFVQAWDLAKGESLWIVETAPAPIAALDVGEDLVAFHHGMTTAGFLKLEDGEAEQGIGGTTAMHASRCLAIDPKDRWVWVGTDTGGLTRLTPGNVHGWSNRGLDNGKVTCLAMDAKGKTLAAGGEDGTVRFVDAKSASVDDKRILDLGSPVVALAIDPKGKSIAAATKNGQVQVWKTKGKKAELTLGEESSGIQAVAFHPKGTQIVTGGSDGKITFWDSKKGTVLGELQVTRDVVAVAFVDKGEGLLVATESESVGLWDLSDWLD